MALTPPTRATSATSTVTTTTPKTISLACLPNDIIVVKAWTGDNGVTLSAPTNDGVALVWTQQVISATALYTKQYIWTSSRVDTSRTIVVSVARSAGTTEYIFKGTVWRASAGFGAVGGPTNNASAASTVTLVSTADNSAVEVAVGDWNAGTGARTRRTVNGSTGTEDTYGTVAGAFTYYGSYYSDVGSAGSNSYGWSAPTGQKYMAEAIEVFGVDPTFGPLAIQYGSIASAANPTIAARTDLAPSGSPNKRALLLKFDRSGGLATGTITGITDTGGNTWTSITLAAVSGSSNTRTEWWYVKPADFTATPGTITVSSGTAQTNAYELLLLDNIDPTTPINTSATVALAATTAHKAPDITPTADNCLVVAGGHWTLSASTALTAGWWQLPNHDDAAGSGRAAYKVLGASTSGVSLTGPTWTTGSQPAGMVTVAFNLASNGATVTAVCATATASASPPALITGAAQTAVAATATALASPPVVAGGGTVTAVLATATAQAYAPTTVTGANVTAVCATATALASAPTIQAGQTVAAVIATATALASPPSFTTGAVLAAVLATATATAYAPAVDDGTVGATVLTFYDGTETWTFGNDGSSDYMMTFGWRLDATGGTVKKIGLYVHASSTGSLTGSYAYLYHFNVGGEPADPMLLGTPVPFGTLVRGQWNWIDVPDYAVTSGEELACGVYMPTSLYSYRAHEFDTEVAALSGAADLFGLQDSVAHVNGGFRGGSAGGNPIGGHSNATSYGIDVWIEQGGSSDGSVTAIIATATALASPPTLTTGANVTAVIATATALASPPVVSGVVVGNVSAAIATATALAIPPTVSGASAGTVNAVCATATALASPPAVTSGAVVAAPRSTATAQAIEPAVSGESVISGGGPATATAMAYPPTVSGGIAGGTVIAVTATASAMARPPVVAGGATVVSVRATATAQGNPPTVAGASAGTVIAVVATATAQAFAPTVRWGSTIAAAVATAAAHANPPVVVALGQTTGIDRIVHIATENRTLTVATTSRLTTVQPEPIRSFLQGSSA